MMEAYEVNMGMSTCVPERRTANTIMMCVRTTHMITHFQDITLESYTQTLLAGNSAGIIKT
jgi:hypothetical protein